MRRTPLLAALGVALIVACDGGAPGEPTPPAHVASVDTLRPGQIAHVLGSGLANLRSLLLDGVPASHRRLTNGGEPSRPAVAALERPSRPVPGPPPRGGPDPAPGSGHA